MQGTLVCVLGVLLVAAGAAAQDCDPTTAGLDLADLADPIGKLACKIPASVNFTDVMSKLTGTLNNLNAEQLKQLPALMEATISVKPEALEPFFSLSATELNNLLPLLTQVSPDTLKEVFPLLADQPDGTLEEMVRLLKGISREQLEKLSPLFSRITEGQVKILVHALNIVPEHAWEALIHIVQQLGPVTDVSVAVQQQKGLLPVSSTRDSDGRVTQTWRPFGFLGRKMLQQEDASQEDLNAAAAAALAAAAASDAAASEAPAAAEAPAPATTEGACDPSAKGIEVAVPLLGDFGPVVCKFTAAALKPIMAEVLDILNKQTPETLAQLPAFTDRLAGLDAATFEAFFKIPQPMLAALIPVATAMDPADVTAQLKLLANLDAASIDKMVYFLSNTPVSQMRILVPMFGKLTDKQADIMARLMNSLSSGQIFLTIHLLDTFGFAIDVISSTIKSADKTGSTFMVGPIQVTVGNKNADTAPAPAPAASAGSSSGIWAFFRHPFHFLVRSDANWSN